LEIAARFTVHAAIDISDGLSLDLARVMKASAVRGVVDLDRVPIHDDGRRRAAADGTDPLVHALTDGEDFELLLAMPPAEARGLVAAPPAGLTPVIIGEVTAGVGLTGRAPDGTLSPLEAGGWMHGGDG
jgi:thiamine-monophosphate kinase